MKSTAVLLVLCLFLSVSISVGVFWVRWDSQLSVILFLGFQLLALGMCCDLSESVLAPIFPAHDLPRLDRLADLPPVALLYTTCDDVVVECLRQLRRQTYPNYDVYVLDDSTDAKYQRTVDKEARAYTVVRRDSRKGFKSGNLNNWLRKYGARYRYFIIFDSDSSAADNFIQEMVKYAEHPANQCVAIFQSKILPWNRDCHFARIIGIMAPCRMKVLQTVHNTIGAVLSFGHNNLHRTEAIQVVGGFDERVTPEDTTMTLMLSQNGFSCRIVSTVSFECEPPDLFRYSKRLIRWGIQTAEVFSLPWENASLELKLVLCRHLYGYLINIVYALMTLFAVWRFRVNFDQSLSFLRYGLSQLTSFSPPFLVLLGITVLPLLQLCLRISLARSVEISSSDSLRHVLLGMAITWFSLFPLAWAVVKTLAGRSSIQFEPTNASSVRQPNLLAILGQMWFTVLFSIPVCIGILLGPGHLIYPNMAYIAIMLLSPLIVWTFHRGERGVETT